MIGSLADNPDVLGTVIERFALILLRADDDELTVCGDFSLSLDFRDRRLRRALRELLEADGSCALREAEARREAGARWAILVRSISMTLES